MESILEPTPSVEEIVAEVGSIDEVVRQRQELIEANVKLKHRDKKPKRKQAKTREITRRHTRGENSIFY